MTLDTGRRAPTRNAWQSFLDATLYNARVNPFNGLTKGMVTTLDMSVKAWFDGKATLEYPEMKKEIADRWRGAHELLLEPGGGLICISCNLCAEACPIDCIEVTFQMDGKTRVLDQYNLDLSKCLFCDLCVEACPVYCIIMTKKYEYSDYSRWEDSTMYLSREKGIERQASHSEFRDMMLRGYAPKYTETTDYFTDEELRVMALPLDQRSHGALATFSDRELAQLPEKGVAFKPRKREDPNKPQHAPARPTGGATGTGAGASAPAMPYVPMDYGDMGEAQYNTWLADERKTSQLAPDERVQKAAFMKLKMKNEAAGATAGPPPAAAGSPTGGAGASAPAPAMDYGDMGQAAYETWLADPRKTSELVPDERVQKAAFMKLKMKNDAAGATGTSAMPGDGGDAVASAPVASAPASDDDYGDMGKEKYDQWMADTRKASELSSEDRMEKSVFIKIKMRRGE